MTCRYCICVKVHKCTAYRIRLLLAIKYMIYLYTSADTLNASARQKSTKVDENAGLDSAAWKVLASRFRADPGD